MKTSNMLIRTTIIIALVISFSNSFAKVYTSKSNGNWNTNGTWSPSKPTVKSSFVDTIIINHNVNLNLDMNFYGVLIVAQGAKLENRSKNLVLKTNSSLINNGTIIIEKFKVEHSTAKAINNGYLLATNSIEISGEVSNSGNMVSEDYIENSGTIINSGTITSEDDFDNYGIINNSNTINVLNDLYNEADIENYGVINVLDDVENKGIVINDGALITDGTVDSNSGTITGDGNLCNSDGLTDPTGGAKGVTCEICKGETSTLPVTLVDFSATYINGVVKINWTTAAEINNNYFEVLKSIDGINYEVIETVLGQGNSNTLTNYEISVNKSNSSVVYYQLRQVDFDGKSSVSKVVKIDSYININTNIYPNPANVGNIVNIESSGKGKISVQVFNISGQLMSELTANDSAITLSTDNLQAGIYMIRIFQNNSIITKKLQIN
jgi:hypothetical protein